MMDPLDLFDPNDVFIRQKNSVIRIGELDRRAAGIERWIDDHDRTGSCFAITRRSPDSVIAWMIAAWRSGSTIAILSDRDPLDQVVAQARKIGALCILPEQRDPPECDPTRSTLDRDRPLTILCTSGSTMQPKAVAHSLNNHWHSAISSNERTPFGRGDRWILSLALWHIGGLAIVWRALAGRGELVIPGDCLRSSIEHQRVTHLSVVATQLSRLLDQGLIKGSLTHILIGGGPIPPSLLDRARHLPIQATYGMTELASQLCTQTVNSKNNYSAGPPLSGWKVVLSAQGEICVDGPALFLGYFRDGELHTARDESGLFHTGDLGSWNDGELVIVGRIDQMFISGGENIYPEEIERCIAAVAGVDAVCVVPIPSDEFGHRPAAFIAGQHKITELQQHLKQQLPRFKHPLHIFQWPSEVSQHKAPREQLKLLALELI